MPKASAAVLFSVSRKRKKEEELSRNKAEEAAKAGKSSNSDLLECLVELKDEDPLTQIQYRDCLIDYTSCPNSHCIKNLT